MQKDDLTLRVGSSDDVFQEGVLGGHESPPTPWHVDRALGHPKTGTPVISALAAFSKVFAIINRTNFKECTASSRSSGIYVPHFFQHFRSARLSGPIFHHCRAFRRASAENLLCIFGDGGSISRTQALWGSSAGRDARYVTAGLTCISDTGLLNGKSKSDCSAVGTAQRVFRQLGTLDFKVG